MEICVNYYHDFQLILKARKNIGFVYLLVTKLMNQSQSWLLPDGSALPLALQPPGGPAGGRRRALSTSSNYSYSEVVVNSNHPLHFGFIPLLVDDPASTLSKLVPSQCAIQKPCDISWLVSTFVSPEEETLAFQDCLAITDISQRGSFLATGLDSNTLYSVRLVSTDAYYNFNWYSSALKTVDTTPPSFLNISGLVFSTNATLGLTLDKPSDVYG